MTDYEFLCRIAEQTLDREEGKEPNKKKGPPPGWDLFMKEHYEGGKRKVSNPNSKTRKDYPQVTVGTAMKDENVKKHVMQEYSEWAKKRNKKPGKVPEKEPDAPIQVSTPTKEPEKKPEKKPSKKVEKKPLHEATDWADPSDPKWESHWAKQAKKLGGKVEHLTVYTGAYYQMINNSLREGKPAPEAKKVQAAVLACKVPHPVRVTRSIGEKDPMYKALKANNLLVGDEITCKGMVSTTIKSPENWNFTGSGVKVVYHVPAGHSGMWVGNPPEPAISQYPHEQELILPHNTKGKVHKIEKQGNDTIVHVLLG